MKHKRILVVDDEVSFTRLLKLNLEQTDEYEVQVENHPEDVLATARKFHPDLILLDLMMPRMGGGDVAARLQADARLKVTPVVFLSAAVGGGKWGEQSGDIAGRPAFIAKPASVEQVLEAIEDKLAKAQSSDDRSSRQHGISSCLDNYLPGWIGETGQLVS